MRNRQLVHCGMTLVELLVVVSIIGLLLAVSVPLLRPVLDSRRTSNAAQVLAGAFQYARMKSHQEGKNYGIKLLPFGTAPTTVIQLRLQKNSPKWVNPPHIRVVVRNGEIIPCCFWQDMVSGAVEWQDRGDTPAEQAELDSVKELLVLGYAIQFNRVGHWFAIEADGKLASPYDALNLPEDPDNKAEALEYSIAALPVTAWVPQTVMPRGMIVDLAFSGGETVGFGGGNNKTESDIPATVFPPSDEVRTHFPTGAEIEIEYVIVMFSPAGHVDWLYISYASTHNGDKYRLPLRFKVNEMLYFCVGEWDRQIENGTTLAEDKKSNLDAPATYWVTIHPKTGEVRIAENAPGSNDVETARKFAREHFFNVGD